MCSPGTFLVANYLIINNGSCQVNFTKPNSATIRCINSQWLRADATEASVGMVAVPKTGQKPPSPREDAPEVPVGRVAVAEGKPKIGHRSDSVGFRETLPFPWHRLDVRNRVYGYGLFQAGIWS